MAEFEYRQKIAKAVSPELPPEQVLYEGRGQSGDFQLNPVLRDLHKNRDLPLATVLIGVVEYEEAPRVILTRRSEKLKKHSGQVAFPGGKVDETDPSPLDAVLRETEEEIGLTAGYIDIAGYLETFETGSGFMVLPVVAYVRPGFELKINAEEVADVFEVPLNFLMNRENHHIKQDVWNGQLRSYYSMSHGQHHIWGVTAGILRNLSERAFDD
ncbi:NUDIX hydrolase [alpha proteobacterium IMCC14465]|uniref:NUDIX hydrolase n=1 Tax=alpha proteobacterium IMCC14465 TaxID=1220535 RepID=J9DI93_9PROT|nr:NUDIX hydrolase [alpha proteobacterium IMCC14465]